MGHVVSVAGWYGGWFLSGCHPANSARQHRRHAHCRGPSSPSVVVGVSGEHDLFKLVTIASGTPTIGRAEVWHQLTVVGGSCRTEISTSDALEQTTVCFLSGITRPCSHLRHAWKITNPQVNCSGANRLQSVSRSNSFGTFSQPVSAHSRRACRDETFR